MERIKIKGNSIEDISGNPEISFNESLISSKDWEKFTKDKTEKEILTKAKITNDKRKPKLGSGESGKKYFSFG